MGEPAKRRDPVDTLVHDHGNLSALLLDVRALAQRVETGEVSWDEAVSEIAHAAVVVRDELVEHFAREEESLFSFIESRVEALRSRSETIRADHQVVVTKADLLCRALEARQQPVVVSALAELEKVYATHSQRELEFLRDVGAVLDTPAREQLELLMAGL